MQQFKCLGAQKRWKQLWRKIKYCRNEEKFSRRKSLILHRTITLLGRRRCHPAASVGSVLVLQDAGIIYYDHYLVVSSYNIQTYRSEHKCLVEPKFSIHTEHLVHLTGSQLYKFLVAFEFCSAPQKVWINSMKYFITYFLDICLSSCPGCSHWNISTYLFTSWLPGSAQLVGWYCCVHGYGGL